METTLRLLKLMSFCFLNYTAVISQNTLPQRLSDNCGETNKSGTSHQDSIKSSFSYQIIDAADNTYGYDILVDNKILIHQTTVPGLSGVTGFIQRSAAIKIAELVVEKMKTGQMPPSVTRADIDNANY